MSKKLKVDLYQNNKRKGSIKGLCWVYNNGRLLSVFTTFDPNGAIEHFKSRGYSVESLSDSERLSETKKTG